MSMFSSKGYGTFSTSTTPFVEVLTNKLEPIYSSLAEDILCSAKRDPRFFVTNDGDNKPFTVLAPLLQERFDSIYQDIREMTGMVDRKEVMEKIYDQLIAKTSLTHAHAVSILLDSERSNLASRGRLDDLYIFLFKKPDLTAARERGSVAPGE